MPVAQSTRYGFSTVVGLEQAAALARVKEELSREGFGVLTEIDVAATLLNKLSVSIPPYVILGACNPALAHRALAAERDVGLLLPCNVIVYAGDTPHTSVIAAMDPAAALALSGNPQLAPIAQEARERLQRALARIGAEPPSFGT
jgi:uncharacterized protein (DUF302 family)